MESAGGCAGKSNGTLLVTEVLAGTGAACPARQYMPLNDGVGVPVVMYAFMSACVSGLFELIKPLRFVNVGGMAVSVLGVMTRSVASGGDPVVVSTYSGPWLGVPLVVPKTDKFKFMEETDAPMSACELMNSPYIYQSRPTTLGGTRHPKLALKGSFNCK